MILNFVNEWGSTTFTPLTVGIQTNPGTLNFIFIFLGFGFFLTLGKVHPMTPNACRRKYIPMSYSGAVITDTLDHDIREEHDDYGRIRRICDYCGGRYEN